MKERKTIKKPSFPLIYLGSILVVGAFLFCIGLAVRSHALADYAEIRNTKGNDIQYSLSNVINNSLSKEKVTKQDIVRIKAFLTAYYSMTSQKHRVFYNRELVADSSQTATMLFSPDEGAAVYLEIADKSYLEYFKKPEIQKYYCIVKNTGDPGDKLLPGNKQLVFACRDIYLDLENARFIPVSCEIIDWANNPQTGGYNFSGTIVNIPVDEDKILKEGYVRIKLTGDNFYMGNIEGFDGPDYDDEYDAAGVSTNPYGVPFGTQHTALILINFEDVYAKEIRAAVFILIFGTLAFSLIPAVIVFNNKKRNYEIFEYRRKTADAMAHDLKTPMAAIASYAENLANHTGEDMQEYYVSKINEKVWQMNKMVGNILEFSKSENGSVTVKKSDADICEIISQLIKDNEHLITGKDLKIDFEKKNVNINTDSELLGQALGNLINNAALYSKEGTTVKIDCSGEQIRIENTPSEIIGDVDQLRKPFEKGDESRKNYGTGLGLAIADNNLAMLGYKMDISSDGGRFIVTIKLK